MEVIGKKFKAEEMFFSNKYRALDKISQGKATAEQWLAMLRKNGAKESEMEWMGLEEFLGDRKAVTKEEVSSACSLSF